MAAVALSSLVRASSEVKLNGSNKCFGPADAVWPAIKRETLWRNGTVRDHREEQMEGRRTMSAHYRH